MTNRWRKAAVPVARTATKVTNPEYPEYRQLNTLMHHIRCFASLFKENLVRIGLQRQRPSQLPLCCKPMSGSLTPHLARFESTKIAKFYQIIEQASDLGVQSCQVDNNCMKFSIIFGSKMTERHSRKDRFYKRYACSGEQVTICVG